MENETNKKVDKKIVENNVVRAETQANKNKLTVCQVSTLFKHDIWISLESKLVNIFEACSNCSFLGAHV